MCQGWPKAIAERRAAPLTQPGGRRTLGGQVDDTGHQSASLGLQCGNVAGESSGAAPEGLSGIQGEDLNRPAKSRPGFGHVRIDQHGAAVGEHLGQSAIRLAAFARRNTPDRPYAVVNDYMALTLGMRMGAPVPPASLVDLGDQTGVVTLAFGQGGVQPPPADFEELHAEYPSEAAAIVALDFLVLNTDRHEENTGYLPRYGVAAWDFDAALFGTRPPVSGEQNLSAGITDPVRGHPLAGFLTDSRALSSWVAAARAIPPDAISRAAYACFDVRLITASERDALVTFIRTRQSALAGLIENRIDDFVRMPRPLIV